jgi:hypothetical protein
MRRIFTLGLLHSRITKLLLDAHAQNIYFRVLHSRITNQLLDAHAQNIYFRAVAQWANKAAVGCACAEYLL